MQQPRHRVTGALRRLSRSTSFRRGVIGAVLASALGTALLGVRYWRSREQARAVAALEADGAQIVYGFQILSHSNDWTSFALHFNPERDYPFPKWFHRLVGLDMFCTVKMVLLEKPVVLQCDINQLNSLPGLECVRLGRYSTEYEEERLRKANPAWYVISESFRLPKRVHDPIPNLPPLRCATDGLHRGE